MSRRILAASMLDCEVLSHGTVHTSPWLPKHLGGRPIDLCWLVHALFLHADLQWECNDIVKLGSKEENRGGEM